MKQLFATIPERFASLFDGAEHPWSPLYGLADFIVRENTGEQRGVISDGATIEGKVEIGEGTIVEPGAVIKGPTIIGKNSVVRSHAYIRGDVVIGEGCTIGHATELVRTIALDNTRLDHFNYVGDSILGSRVHFGAGAKVANLRFDNAEISVGDIATGRQKLGVILGDDCQLGVNVVLGPGVILKPNTWVAGIDIMQSGTYGKEEIKMLLAKS